MRPRARSEEAMLARGSRSADRGPNGESPGAGRSSQGTPERTRSKDRLRLKSTEKEREEEGDELARGPRGWLNAGAEVEGPL